MASIGSASDGGFLESAAKAIIERDKSGNLGPYMISWVKQSRRGAALISRWIADYMLFGVMLHQLAIWCSTATADRSFVKVTVVSRVACWWRLGGRLGCANV